MLHCKRPLQVTYEAYGAGGTGASFVIECLTDNVNRTAAAVRTAVKMGGKMADSGSVLFNFRRQGVLVVDAQAEDEVRIAGLTETNHPCSVPSLRSWQAVSCQTQGRLGLVEEVWHLLHLRHVSQNRIASDVYVFLEAPHPRFCICKWLSREEQSNDGGELPKVVEYCNRQSPSL